MIPKKIHYCWFGGKPLPENAKKCINSWKKFFPDYEIIEWNESNYNIYKNNYIKNAYEQKKYAFVSDYVRFDVLYDYGGIYFDVDVEVINRFDDKLLERGFFGFEYDYKLINPGLGMGAHPKTNIYKDILNFYEQKEFSLSFDKINNSVETVCTYTTNILVKHGLNLNEVYQIVEDIVILPKEFLNPYDYLTGKLKITNNTLSIHWYNMSWLSFPLKIKVYLARPIRRFIKAVCFKKNKGV